jgi:hypothetical protein
MWAGERLHWQFIILQHKNAVSYFYQITLRHIQEHNPPRKKIKHWEEGRRNKLEWGRKEILQAESKAGVGQAKSEGEAKWLCWRACLGLRGFSELCEGRDIWTAQHESLLWCESHHREVIRHRTATRRTTVRYSTHWYLLPSSSHNWLHRADTFRSY